MTHEELRKANETCLEIKQYQDETQLIFINEDEEIAPTLIELLQDENITGEERKALKQIAFPYLYGIPVKDTAVQLMGRPRGKSFYQNPLKYCTFSETYFIPTKIKKGSGKGKYRLQKVTIKSKNSVDNLTWLK